MREKLRRLKSLTRLRRELANPRLTSRERAEVEQRIAALERGKFRRSATERASPRLSRLAGVPAPYSVRRLPTTDKNVRIYRVEINRRYASLRAPVALSEHASFYLSSYGAESLDVVQRSVLRVAQYSGLSELTLVEERQGSIWRRFKGSVDKALDSETVQKKSAEIDAAISLALIGRAQAEVDSINAASIRDLIDGLKDVENGCAQVGGNLVVKFLPSGAAVPVLLARRLTVLDVVPRQVANSVA